MLPESLFAEVWSDLNRAAVLFANERELDGGLRDAAISDFMKAAVYQSWQSHINAIENNFRCAMDEFIRRCEEIDKREVALLLASIGAPTRN